MKAKLAATLPALLVAIAAAQPAEAATERLHNEKPIYFTADQYAKTSTAPAAKDSYVAAVAANPAVTAGPETTIYFRTYIATDALHPKPHAKTAAREGGIPEQKLPIWFPKV